MTNITKKNNNEIRIPAGLIKGITALVTSEIVTTTLSGTVGYIMKKKQVKYPALKSVMISAPLITFTSIVFGKYALNAVEEDDIIINLDELKQKFSKPKSVENKSEKIDVSSNGFYMEDENPYAHVED